MAFSHVYARCFVWRKTGGHFTIGLCQQLMQLNKFCSAKDVYTWTRSQKVCWDCKVFYSSSPSFSTRARAASVLRECSMKRRPRTISPRFALSLGRSNSSSCFSSSELNQQFSPVSVSQLGLSEEEKEEEEPKGEEEDQSVPLQKQLTAIHCNSRNGAGQTRGLKAAI